jgi:hypothetical protein
MYAATRRLSQMREVPTMNPNEARVVSRDPTAELEIAFMEEYLGFPLAGLNRYPPDEARRLETKASTHASLHMEEIHSRAHVVHELHRCLPCSQLVLMAG